MMCQARRGGGAGQEALEPRLEIPGVGGADQCEAALKKQGMQAAARESYPVGAKDFTSELLKFKQAGADALILYVQNPSDVAIILAATRCERAEEAYQRLFDDNPALSGSGARFKGVSSSWSHIINANETTFNRHEESLQDRTHQFVRSQWRIEWQLSPPAASLEACYRRRSF